LVRPCRAIQAEEVDVDELRLLAAAAGEEDVIADDQRGGGELQHGEVLVGGREFPG
jgi:hypothetical protein